MQNNDLMSLIKEDKMQVNVKNHMTFTLRLFWTVIIAFLIIAFVNIYHRQNIVINLLITIAVFLPLMWSVIRRRIQNKKIRSRYPYAFKSVVESYPIFDPSEQFCIISGVILRYKMVKKPLFPWFWSLEPDL